MDPQPLPCKLDVIVDTTGYLSEPNADNEGSFATQLRDMIQERVDDGYKLEGLIPNLGVDDKSYGFTALIYTKPRNESPDADHYDVVPNTTVAKGTPYGPDTPQPARRSPPLSAL